MLFGAGVEARGRTPGMTHDCRADFTVLSAFRHMVASGLQNALSLSGPLTPPVKHTVLIADDEADVLRLVSMSFASAGFSVLEAFDGTTALETARQQTPSLAVLDLMMPGLTGFEVIRALKRDGATALIPVILLSAHADEANRVLGFELGADDFVRKPFSPRELVLRGRAILDRKQHAPQVAAQLLTGAIALDPERCTVLVHGDRVPLTAIEFKLLAHLARHPGRVFQRESLLTQIWGDDVNIDTRTVDTHIRRLRDKLGPAANQVVTVRGFGYRLDDQA